MRLATLVALWATALLSASRIEAQGVGTGTIRGRVASQSGADVNGTRVQIKNVSTGLTSQAEVRGGRFVIRGLEVGGPYVIELTHIGFLPERTPAVFVSLGEPLDVDLVMHPLRTQLDTMLIVERPEGIAGATAGAATTISDSLVHRLPTLNRNFFDFLRLAPQVSTKVGSGRIGLSAAGANLRFNNFLISDTDERLVNGNVSAALNGGKSIPIDAVKEYQVAVAPYDIRYGDFTGVLVNTVTQSGTNHFRGSAFGYWRNDKLARRGDLASSLPYERMQYGFSLGGPILRDKIHFFIAPEIQRLTLPAAGAYIGQPATSLPALTVNAADVDRLSSIMRAYGLEAGSGGMVENQSPLRNLFARVDAGLPRWNSRALAFVNYSRSGITSFSRAAPDTFYLSSYQFSTLASVRMTSLQLHTDLRRLGAHNQLILSELADRQDITAGAQQPVVHVVVPRAGGGLITLTSGTAEGAQGRFARNRSISMRDEFSLSVGSQNVLLLGFQAERFRIQKGGVAGSFGTWTFLSLDSLESGVAGRYEVRKDFGSATSPLSGMQYAAWLGNEWRVNQRLTVTTGIRGDASDFKSHAPYNAIVDSIFNRRTDEMPRARIHISPRLGFNWDMTGNGSNRMRGGVGLFTGRPPRGWIAPAVISYGAGIGVLRCGSLQSDVGRPRLFVPDYQAAPTSCATGATLATAPLGDVDLLDKNLRMAQSVRASLAYERRLAGDVVSTTEALITRNVADYRFVNLNLKGPQATDRFGRVLYGTVALSGVATPAVRSGFSEVIDLTNTSRNHSYVLSTKLERRFAGQFAASASYSFSRTRDVQSPSRLNMAGIVMWADARAVSGLHETVTPEVSLNDLPHRVVFALTYAAPWRKAPTDFSVYYVGESGTPFTYLAFGTNRRGDLNADGSNANDPIYVPRDAFDPSEITFTGRSDSTGADNSSTTQAIRTHAQQSALQSLIDRTPCLRNQRGRILRRNSCREPWSNTSIAAIRQAIPIGDRAIEAEFDVFNLLNLLNGRWGRFRISSPRLLEHVAQTEGTSDTGQPVFRFSTTRPDWTTVQTESAFQLQLALRYRF
ncbi:MAG TPA: TonB-dependent receptor [Gemmatimonadaceae bacterium]|nr:TonB-dependent receptor [Gemmatimonadaceae bacterium]